MRMRSALFLLILALAFVGCKSEEPGATNGPVTSSSEPVTQEPTPSGTAPSVAPMATGAAGGATPMANTESVEGSGSGVNQAAKDQARRAAGMAGGSTAAPAPEEGN